MSLVVDNVVRAVNPAIEHGVIAASAPPAIITSQVPSCILLYDSPIALAPVAQAVTVLTSVSYTHLDVYKRQN